MKTQILIVDFGSQYTTIIARTLADIGFRSVTLDPKKVSDYLVEHEPKAIILSGGNASVYDEQAPTICNEVLSGKYFVLGICYGMQLIAHLKDPSSVKKGDTQQKGYGPVLVKLNNASGVLFNNLDNELRVWASHGDIVSKVPGGFYAIAYSENGHSSEGIEAMQSDDGKFFAVQFHPEVIETEDENMILKNFVEHAGCEPDWNPGNVIQIIQNETLTQYLVKEEHCLVRAAELIQQHLPRFLPLRSAISLLSSLLIMEP